MKSFSILMLLFLMSCSSKIVKDRPDFHLQGEAAKKEQEKFTLSHVSIHGGQFQQEGPFTSFRMREYRDTMKEVSPKSVEMLDDTRTKENLMWLVAGAWIATTFIRTEDDSISPLYWWGAGAFIGYGFYLQYYRDKALDQYNDDLKKKFAPSVGYRFSFQ